MEQATIDSITYWITLITLLVQYVGGIFLVVTAGLEALRNKAVRLDRIVTVGIILILIPYGIRNYGLELADASIDLLNGLTDKRPEIEAAVERFLNENNPDNGGSNVTVPTAVFTSTPLPTIENATDFDATATAYFGDFPTALPAQPTSTSIPTGTPRPMIEPTWTDYQHQTNGTPEPTVFLCRTVEEVAAGCVPATSTPGN